MDDARLEATTGRTVEQWVEVLDAHGGRSLDHTALARLVPPLLPAEVENKGWWAQSVTVRYEQETGRRVVGQKSDGSFSVSVSKTFHGSRERALDAWCRVVAGLTEVDGVAVDGEPRRTSTARWSRWRARLAEGSSVAGERWRTVWKALVAQLD